MAAKGSLDWCADFIGRTDTTDIRDDNSDVVVRFGDGREYVATFFTVENLRQLMLKFQKTGENAHGLYVWSTQMIVVEALTSEVVNQVVDDLLTSGKFETAFTPSTSTLEE